ncbi:MAG: hypothetical protein R2725_09340 [Solirubrobacterales bacterium]
MIQIAPPLVCDRAQLDELADSLAATLADAGRHMELDDTTTPEVSR